jgi:hypothetical protein
MNSRNPNSIHEKNPNFRVFSCLRSIFICLCLCSKIGLWSKNGLCSKIGLWSKNGLCEKNGLWSKVGLCEKIRLCRKRLFQALFFAERHRSELRETRILSRSLNR